MSPDQYLELPIIRKMLKATAGLVEAFPSLGKYLVADPSDVRGMTLFLGDSNEYVVGLRIFGDDGSPMIMWSSGGTVLEALMNLDRAVATGNFKKDKKANPPPPPKKKKS